MEGLDILGPNKGVSDQLRRAPISTNMSSYFHKSASNWIQLEILAFHVFARRPYRLRYSFGLATELATVNRDQDCTGAGTFSLAHVWLAITMRTVRLGIVMEQNGH